MKRTEVVGVRLDPKLKYLAEIAARSQRKTLSSFIKWAVRESLGTIELKEGHSLNELAPFIWAPDPETRLALLAQWLPDLLNYWEERKIKHEPRHLSTPVPAGPIAD